MFDNKNFYPTPTHLIEKMLEGIKLSVTTTILEPSAGKGDIVDGIISKNKYSMWRNDKLDIDCIELDETLQATLKGKKYRVVYDDFLTFETFKQYDLIIMNPPFDNGDKHLLKAVEMQEPNGGGIICLLNAETLRNLYSNTRKLLARKLEELNAKIEYIPNAFMDAERKTNVEIALIKIVIDKPTRNSEMYDKLKKESQVAISARRESVEHNKLTAFTEESNFLELIVEQYNLEIKLGVNLIREYEAMLPYIKKSITHKRYDDKGNEIKEPEDKSPSLKLIVCDENKSSNINDYIKLVRYKYWCGLFKNPKFVGRLTSNLRIDFQNRVEQLQDYEFNMYNIFTIKEELMNKNIENIEKTILDLFDELSHKYSYIGETSKNIHFFNGWKTNNAFKINKKVIIPLNGYSWYLSYKARDKLSDITKIFDYLDCGLTENINILEELNNAEKSGTNKNIQLKYFTVTFYKKGTCHIVFTNDKLLEKFNLFGCQKKGWLPPHYGRKSYEDMTPEEKDVVKEFSGSEEEYNKIIQKQDYYITNSQNWLMLADENKTYITGGETQ